VARVAGVLAELGETAEPRDALVVHKKWLPDIGQRSVALAVVASWARRVPEDLKRLLLVSVLLTERV